MAGIEAIQPRPFCFRRTVGVGQCEPFRFHGFCAWAPASTDVHLAPIRNAPGDDAMLREPLAYELMANFTSR
jgi:hypothetical protein